MILTRVNSYRILYVSFLSFMLLPLTSVGLHGQKQNFVTGDLRVVVFDVDATHPVGSLLAYDSMVNSWDLGLRES
jgi:hypothetical protein